MTDIIIPVYNQYARLPAFLAELEKSVNTQGDRIVMIDDASSDKRVQAYLIRWQQSHANAILLRNQKKQGYGASVNRALREAQGQNDVIFLNLETKLMAGWTDGLRNAAAVYPEAEILTPLSPQQGAFLPKVVSESEKAAKKISEFAQNQCFPAPWHLCLGVYVRRSVIAQIGFFDESLEAESLLDFFCRAEQAGITDYVCDSAWLPICTPFFETLTSVSREKLRHRFKNYSFAATKLSEKSPLYRAGDRLRLLLLAEELQNEHKNLLLLSNQDFRLDAQKHMGGIQSHLKDMVMGLRDEFNVFVVARDEEMLRLTAYFGQNHLSFSYPIGRASDTLRIADFYLRDILKEILNAIPIGAIHVHQVMGLSMDIFHLAAERNIPLYYTIHDYYTVCPGLVLLDEEMRECIGKDTPRKCQTCLAQKGILVEVGQKSMSCWRAEWKKSLLLCDKIFAPSQTAKEIFLRYYPDLQERVKVVEHGLTLTPPVGAAREKKSADIQSYIEKIDITPKGNISIQGWAYLEEKDSQSSTIYLEVGDRTKMLRVPCKTFWRNDLAQRGQRYGYSGFQVTVPHQSEWRNGAQLTLRPWISQEESAFGATFDTPFIYDVPMEKEKRINMGFIGGINQIKGADIIKALLDKAPPQVHFTIIGAIGDSELKAMERPNLTKTGPYIRDELPSLVLEHDLDMVGIFSVCSETFCYTLSESLAMHLPVVATDTGALGARVRAMSCGWVFPAEQCAEQVARLLSEILKTPQLLEEKRQLVSALTLRTAQEMVQFYKKAYHWRSNDSKSTLQLANQQVAYFYAHPHSERSVRYADYQHLKNLWESASKSAEEQKQRNEKLESCLLETQMQLEQQTKLLQPLKQNEAISQE